MHLFGINIFFGDGWQLVPLLQKLHLGTLEVSDLFAQHNEHRYLFPRIAMLLLGSVTEYSTVPQMHLLLVFFIVTLAGIYFVFRDNLGHQPLFILPLFIPVSFLVFSLRQYGNMLWGLQVTYALAQAFAILAFCFLYFSGRGSTFGKLLFSAALASATIATFSTVQGLLVWPAGLLQLLIIPTERSKKKFLIGVWSLAGLGEWVLYFFNYTRPRDSPSPFFVLEHPVQGIDYFVTLLGSSLFWEHSMTLIWGSLLLILAAVSLFIAYRDGKLGESSFWIALLTFSLLVLVLTTIGRSERGDGGWNSALDSRFTAFSILAVISVYAMLLRQALERSSQAIATLAGIILGIILLSTPLSYLNGVRSGAATETRRENAAFVVATHETQPAEVLNQIPIPQDLIPSGSISKSEYFNFLDRHDYNVFSGRAQILPPPLSSLSSAASSTQSSINFINDMRIGRQTQPIVISEEAAFVRITGWAVDDEAEDAAGGVYVEIDGKRFPAYYGRPTRGLVERFGIPSYQNSGFERTIAMSEIGPGIHELSLVVVTADGEGYYRPDQKVIFTVI